MITLQPVTMENYDDCLALKRQRHDFVGDACAVLADAYIYRETSQAYALYLGEDVIGLVILSERAKRQSYEFTDLFIADDYRGRGYGTEAVRAIIRHFADRGAESIHMQVHKANEAALHVYLKCGFTVQKPSPWDDDFVILERTLDS